MVKYIQQKQQRDDLKIVQLTKNKNSTKKEKGRKKHEKNIIYSNIIGGFADGGINCTGSSAGSYNVALF